MSVTELPNKELHAAIKAAAVTAECADPVHATALAIEAFTKGEFADESQVESWFALQRIKKPSLFQVPEVDAGADTNGASKGKAKGDANPFAANFKGADRNAAIANYIRQFGTKAASRMAASAGADIAGRPLRQ
jgi:hypothetical protein